MKTYLRISILILTFISLWQLVVLTSKIPDYFLPTPWQVLLALKQQFPLLAQNAMISLIEALSGFILALFGGACAAIVIFRLRVVGFLLMPLLVISQALPTFAVAPLLVLWFGYGFVSKVVLVIMIIFFPITAALLDGLRRTNPLWLIQAHLMTDNPWHILWQVQLPGALPHFASGIRIAAAGAMMGAIIGEWVGASQGLGFLLLEENARLETALVFANLTVLIILSLSFYKSIDYLLKRWITW